MIATTGGDGWWKGESRNAKKNLLPSTMLECKTALTNYFLLSVQNSHCKGTMFLRNFQIFRQLSCDCAVF